MKTVIHTVLGDIDAKQAGITLPHEHIVVAYEPFLAMSGKNYLDKEEALRITVIPIGNLGKSPLKEN